MENLDTKGKRLSYLINSKIIDLSKSQLADLIGISPTLLSFYISGNRNIKDEHLKEIYKHFPKVNSEWLEQGIGQALRQISNSQSGTLFGFDDENHSNTDIYTQRNDVKPVQEFPQDRNFEPKTPVFTETTEKTLPEQTKIVEKIIEKTIDKKIERIVVLYNNGTFEELSV